VRPGPLEEAVAAALRGEPIVFPTDTVYGIATRPDRVAATALLFEAKGRARDLTLPVLVPGVASAREIAEFDWRAEALAAAHWPGALTIVLMRAAASRDWDLGGDPETIGVRVPRHPLAVAVLVAAGPLAVTSANRSGRPPATTCAELEATFGGLVSVYLCQDEPLTGAASTVVDLAHGAPRLVRAGGLPADAISRILGGEGPLLDSRLPR
jgi:L-threonylcarbamoyladenylate synthase